MTPSTFRAVLLVPALAACGAAAQATTIDVLWYTYADPTSEYRTTGVPGLAARSASDPMSSGLNWNVTFWAPHDPVPDFTAYDVLFVATGEAFRTGAAGGSTEATPDYSGILDNKAAIAAARGERTFIDGADAEFHAIRGDSGNCAGASCSQWDGAVGHVINAVNWAGSGRGLGVFASFDGAFDGAYWWTNANSFLHDELAGSVRVFSNSRSAENTPLIDATEAAYPLNHGLTSTGLSNWNNSFHAGFLHGLAGYSEVVASTRYPDYSVAIATTSFIAAPTAPLAAVPEPGTWALLVAGLAVVGGATGRCREKSKAGVSRPG